MPAATRPAVFDGPVELVKIIFDTAARNEQATAATLAQVCKTSRDWSTPILYENVHLSDNPSAKRFERMLDAAMSAHGSPYASHSPLPPVKTLQGTCMPTNLDALLSSKRQSLEALTLHNYDAHKLQHLSMSASLTHVTIAGSLRYVHFTQAMLAGLRHVSHLRFPNDVPRLPPLDGRSGRTGGMLLLPKLTHFSCCYQPAKKSHHDELERCLDTVLTGAPCLHLVVVYVHRETAPPRQFGGRSPDVRLSVSVSVSDRRVVFASPADLPEETKNLSPTYDAVWRIGERKLRFSDEYR